MGDAEVFARQAFEKITGNGLARRESNRVNKAVKLIPMLAELVKQRCNLCVVSHITFEDELGAEIGSKLGDAVLEPFTLVAEGQLGAFAVAGAGDAIGD